MADADSSTSVRRVEVALLGNPNTGKTSLFNALTGMRQRVGNYPGITVEKKTGIVKLPECEAELIDLPGTYSIAAASPDERVVVDVLTGNVEGTAPPEAIICVVDASNLLRNLFLASQVAELEIPMVIALNLWDAAQKKNLTINPQELSKRLGVPVIPTVARRSEGVDGLKIALAEVIEKKPKMTRVEWPDSVRGAVDELRGALPKPVEQDLTETEVWRLLFDADSAILDRVDWDHEAARAAIEKSRKHLWNSGMNPLAAEALIQYEHLRKILDGVLTTPGEKEEVQAGTESIDKLMIHRGWGLAIFVSMMFLVFECIYTFAGPLMDGVGDFMEFAKGLVGPWFDSMPMVQSLVTDGIIEGVGAFVVFLPQILILFFFIALLEDTGYMSRAAFLMDKLFHWCGLNGKSFVPMLSSYACAVPGIMATRTIEDPKARLTTILLAPLMSCSARLPVYVLLIGAFVQPAYGAFWAGVALLAMHLLGLLIAVPLAFFITRYLIKTKVQPFVLEMPPYRVPRMRNVFFRMYEAGREFVERAGTVIMAITIIIWALLYFPRPEGLEQSITDDFAIEKSQETGLQVAEIEAQLDSGDSEFAAELEGRLDKAFTGQSYLYRMGHATQPIFDWAGYDWKITVGVLASFPAREVIISTLGVIYSLDGEVDEESDDLKDALRAEKWSEGKRAGQPVFTLPVVFGIMVFFALCSQCGSTLAVIIKETNWRWAAFVFVYMTVLAWIGGVAVYQIGTRLM